MPPPCRTWAHSRLIFPDFIAPTGTLSAPDITQPGIATVTITAVLTDNAAINFNSILRQRSARDESNWPVIAVKQVIRPHKPMGRSSQCNLSSPRPYEPSPANDNGLYTAQLSGVTDTSGNFLPTIFTEFQVNIAAPVPPTFMIGTFGKIDGKQKTLKFRDMPDGTDGDHHRHRRHGCKLSRKEPATPSIWSSSTTAKG